MSRPVGTADELERRRKRAVQAVTDGQPRATVAQVLGVHYRTVARWVRAARKPGGLDARPQPAPASGLTDADLRKREGLLTKGAKAHGWHNELWTAARVVERHFDIRDHPEHVRKILKRRLGWTSQKPRRKARERDDTAVARWVGDEFPRIVRGAWRRSAYLMFLDEPGFFLTPTVRRTLAPRGKTPVLEARDRRDRRDRWSAISGVTVSPVAGRPGRYFDLLDHNVHGEDVVAFLAELHRRLGRVTVVWDRNQIHSKSKVVRAWLAGHPDVVAEDFPGYVPDLNPDEGVWGWTRYGRLANLAAADKDELWDRVVDELIEVKFRPNLLRGFIQQTRLPGLALVA
jgi:transposase